jgi:hypothetical protein
MDANFLVKGREDMRMKRYLAAVSTVAVLALTGLAGTAGAQTTQNGLVNISLTNTTVQIPIGIAANVCDVNVAALATLVRTGGSTTCTAVADATAMPVTVGTAPAGSTTQNGLVNVSLTNTTIQVPIAAAVNLCDVNVAILAVLTTSPASCTATSHSGAG